LISVWTSKGEKELSDVLAEKLTPKVALEEKAASKVSLSLSLSISLSLSLSLFLISSHLKQP
jgi:hypothetical protein